MFPVKPVVRLVPVRSWALVAEQRSLCFPRAVTYTQSAQFHF